MKLIADNPFRVLDIYSNSRRSVMQNKKSRFSKLVKIGMRIQTDINFKFLPNLERTEVNINDSLCFLDNRNNKLKSALFWFVNLSNEDSNAFYALNKGEKAEASGIWFERVFNKEITADNISSLSNLSSLQLMSEKLTTFQHGVSNKIKLIQSEYFDCITSKITNDSIRVDVDKLEEFFIDEIINYDGLVDKTILGKYRRFALCSNSIKEKVIKILSERELHEIESSVVFFENESLLNKESGIEFAKRAYEVNENKLKDVFILIGDGDLKLNSISDKFAKEIRQMAVTGFNYWFKSRQREDEYLDIMLKIKPYSKNVVTKSKINDDISDFRRRVRLRNRAVV